MCIEVFIQGPEKSVGPVWVVCQKRGIKKLRVFEENIWGYVPTQKDYIASWCLFICTFHNTWSKRKILEKKEFALKLLWDKIEMLGIEESLPSKGVANPGET